MTALALLVAGAFFMEFLDGSIITTALPYIAHDLGTPPVALQAAVSIYLFTVAVFILPTGWMADRFGPRRIFMFAVVLFTLSSVLCGLAGSPGALVTSRALQGLGGAMMVPVGRLAVLRTTPKTGLLQAIALLTWPALTAPLIGPPLGGFLAEHLSWRAIFFVNVPLGAIGLVLARRLVPAEPGGTSRPFDIAGFVLASALFAIVMLGADEVGQSRGSVVPALALAAGATCLGLLLRRHIRRHPHPIIDPGCLAVPTFRATLFGGSLVRTLISAVPFLLPLMLQLGLGFDGVRAGLFVLVLFAGNLLIKPATSPIIRSAGFRSTLVGNGLLQAVTMVGCAALGSALPTAAIAILLLLSGASRSLEFTALNTLAFADVPAENMSSANTLFSVAFQASNGLGVAIGAALVRLAAAVSGGDPAAPVLADFRAAFLTLAVLMVSVSLNLARLPRRAGKAVLER